MGSVASAPSEDAMKSRSIVRVSSLFAAAVFGLAALALPGPAQAQISVLNTASTFSLTNNPTTNDAAFTQGFSYSVSGASNEVLIVDYGAFVQTPGTSPTGDAYNTTMQWVTSSGTQGLTPTTVFLANNGTNISPCPARSLQLPSP
jgi:hypothetical protein